MQAKLKREAANQRLMLARDASQRPTIPPADEPLAPLPVPEDLPRGYLDYQFGQSFDEVNALLTKDTAFYFRPEMDVSFLDTPVRRIVSTPGLSIVSQGIFQFSENDALYSITINVNPDRVDFYSLFNTLRTKYGEPKTYSPAGAEWNNDTTIVKLEYPLTVKYLDKVIMDSMAEEEVKQNVTQQQSTENFLQNF